VKIGKIQILQVSSIIPLRSHRPPDIDDIVALLVIAYTVVIVIANTAQSVAFISCQFH